VTGPDATTNVATDSAQIGVQAGTVHGDVNLYAISPDASPEEKFEKGVLYLDGRMPSKARQLIDEAVVAGYTTHRVYFYWLLAMVAGRTQRELSEEENARLQRMQNALPIAGDDEWADGVRNICRLLESAQNSNVDLRVLLKEIDELDETQRILIPAHMEVFLEGPIKDQMWDRILKRAKKEQMAGERANRVWKFFHPDPQRPWSNPPRPVMISIITWGQAVTATAALAAMMIHVGYLLVQAGRILPLVAYLLGVTGGYLGARASVEWRFRIVRLRAKDQQYKMPVQRRGSAPQGGFASRVEQQLDHYFNKYVPRHVERQPWLSATAGNRRSIRDEIVEVYRAQRVGVEKISWLIRYRVGDVRRRWENGALWNYQQELATPLRVKARAVSGFAVLAGGGTWAVEAAVKASPLSATRSTVLALVCGWIAARAWLHINLERRRYAADRCESEQTFEDDKAAFERWKAKLANKPDDREMAAWLDCDRKVLLNEALQHYKLTMSNVIAHAFIEAPAVSTKRARVRNGPWRYTRYQLLVFLLTADGVRQLTVNLDFEQGIFHDRQRTNYRYDAVAAVRVHHADNSEWKFDLALVNGNEISVSTIGSGIEELQQGEDPGAVSEVTLDAAGFHHTLHVLEGIAAEGKEWITHEYRR
jgi:hypothetical protein